MSPDRLYERGKAIRSKIENADSYSPLPYATVNVPTAPGHNAHGLKGSRPRHVVAKDNTMLKVSERNLFGNPTFLKESPPVTPVYEITDENGAETIITRELGLRQTAPYAIEGYLLAATERLRSSPQELKASGQTHIDTRLAKTLRPQAAKAYTALQMSALRAAHNFRQDDEIRRAVLMENHLVSITQDGKPTPRTIADIHSHAVSYNFTDFQDREGEDFAELVAESTVLTKTPEILAGMAVSAQNFLRPNLFNQGFSRDDIDQLDIVPGVNAPVGIRLVYNGILVDSLTNPDSITLIAAVNNGLYNAYAQALSEVEEQLPQQALEHEGQIFPRLPNPGFRQISYINEGGKLVQAVNPVLVYQIHGAPNAAGVHANRGEAYTLSLQRAAVAADFRKQGGEEIEKTMRDLGIAA